MRALALVERTGHSFQETFRSLTAVRCDCCSETFVDEVALIVIEEALVEYRDALLAKAERDRAAWAEAHAVTAEALSTAKAGQGA